MKFGGAGMGKRGQLVLAVGLWLAAFPAAVNAQLFTGPTIQRPPADVPSVSPGPPQSVTPPATPSPPKGPTLQSLPPVAAPAPAANPAIPVVPTGHASLAVSARFGRDLPA